MLSGFVAVDVVLGRVRPLAASVVLVPISMGLPLGWMERLDLMKRAALFSSVIAAALLAMPREAEACGGTFCDTGPNAMPVPQTGENILFAMGEGYTEAHIQIQYDPNTEAAKFAWVVPMTALPEFSVGSQTLFTNVLASTVPAYGFNYTFDSCGDQGNSSGLTGAGDGGDPGGTSAGDETGGETGPEVVLHETVGAFEITVLQGGTAEEVMTWLGANGYQQDAAAEPILAEYLAENYIFAAFKLTNGAEIGEIHPITLRFANDEACVPLRLTRIAAEEDMEVRTFFLANDRVVPQNYKHVLVNPLELDWPNFASNYKEIITLAVDAFGADGKAFVTEYAGPSSIVNPSGVFDASWSPAAFEGLDPIAVVDTLSSQNLMFCDEFNGCVFIHPLIEGLLAQFLPVPDGLGRDEFYGCLSCNEAMIDTMAWGDGSGFSTAMQERIVAPGQHAADLLAQFPTLTRMYTTISPAEMTEDPFFWQNPDLPPVDLTASLATRRIFCNGDALWTLPDGKEVLVPDDGAWPEFGDEMPYVEEIATTPANGAPIAIVDNRTSIQGQLDAYNCALGYPAVTCGDNADSSGGSASGGSASGGDSSGSDTAGENDGGGSGCGCNSGGSTSGVLLLLGAIALRRRRRDR
jgi:MYXO-CTERM domain-containing protein